MITVAAECLASRRVVGSAFPSACRITVKAYVQTRCLELQGYGFDRLQNEQHSNAKIG